MYLAQINVARMLAPIDSEQLKGFVDLLAPINAIAEQSPGFIWRYQTESGNATEVRLGDDPMLLVNFSVWRDVESLRSFVYAGLHRQALGQRKEWFELPKEMHYALYWIEESHAPNLEEALERLQHLRVNGETPHAFTFRSQL